MMPTPNLPDDKLLLLDAGFGIAILSEVDHVIHSASMVVGLAYISARLVGFVYDKFIKRPKV